jgi:putative spermidine/putrescine transport system ATP-binding protein
MIVNGSLLGSVLRRQKRDRPRRKTGRRPVPSLEVRHLSKRYGDRGAVDDISLTVEEGELVCVVGPSGCGKTTLLRSVAGLLAPDSGRIAITGQVVFSSNPRMVVKTEHRGIGLVFQDYSLWPHMNVEQHLRFPMETAGIPRSERNERVAHLLELVRLSGYEKRRPSELSGGQQQRVALARALAARPRLLLMDEPMSNLDARLRQEMRGEIVRLVRDTGVATLYVTHDQAEAMSIADKIVVLRDGKKVQEGEPASVYERPADIELADFLGIGSIVSAAPGLRFGEAIVAGDVSVELAGFDTSKVVQAVVPISALRMGEQRSGCDEVSLSATVRGAAYEGGSWLVNAGISSAGESVQFRSERPMAKGAEVTVTLAPGRLLPFAADGSLCLQEPAASGQIYSSEVALS